MAKKVLRTIRIVLPAGEAQPGPQLSPAFGDIDGFKNLIEVSRSFNTATEAFEKGIPITATFTVYADHSFTFETSKPLVSYYLKRAAGIEKGSGEPNTDKVGKVTRAQLEEIAKLKDADITGADLEAQIRTIAGSARSAGIEVVD